MNDKEHQKVRRLLDEVSTRTFQDLSTELIVDYLLSVSDYMQRECQKVGNWSPINRRREISRDVWSRTRCSRDNSFCIVSLQMDFLQKLKTIKPRTKMGESGPLTPNATFTVRSWNLRDVVYYELLKSRWGSLSTSSNKIKLRFDGKTAGMRRKTLQANSASRQSPARDAKPVWKYLERVKCSICSDRCSRPFPESDSV